MTKDGLWTIYRKSPQSDRLSGPVSDSKPRALTSIPLITLVLLGLACLAVWVIGIWVAIA
jgi:hypothetical protein